MMSAKQAEMYENLLVICALTTELERYGVNAVGLCSEEQSMSIIAVATGINQVVTRDQQIADMTRIYTDRIAKLPVDYKTEAAANG
jgi:hypothetical protein